MKLRIYPTVYAALATALVALTGTLLGAYSGARLSQHETTAAAQWAGLQEYANVPPSSTNIISSQIPAAGAGFNRGRPITVAATGSQPDQITFGDAGQMEPQARFSGGTAVPAVDTLPIPLNNIFVGHAQAQHAAELHLIPMVLQGQVKGVVHLEGRASSLGGYAATGEEIHFLAADGSFSFRWGGGPADIWIKAPGHLSVVIPRAEVASGQVLTVPELTLPFGDANGDGRIDVLDLSIAAANFGEAARSMPLP